MSAKSLLMGTAFLLTLFGVSALFVPDAVASVLDLGGDPEVALQLFGGSLLAFAALNWIGRGAVYGGIFGRPIVLSNLALGIISTGTLISACLDGRAGPWAWGLVAWFGLHAIAFAVVLRSPPWSDGDGDGA